MSETGSTTAPGAFAFPGREDRNDVEQGTQLRPKFDEQGLIPCVVQDATSGDVLMVAYMNDVSLSETLRSGYATFWSRSRQKLWKKGESSGHTLDVQELLVDCDQDCIIAKVKMNGPAACHTGRVSCFYRKVDDGDIRTESPSFELALVGEGPKFDPNEVYGK